MLTTLPPAKLVPENTSGGTFPPKVDTLRLTIVLPALNEEDAIGSTIERCLAARETIIEHTPVSEIQVVVVSDGSTDRTPEIARAFEEVQVVEFPKNRGYGAAIKEGWRVDGGDLLAFLDADGTCDPVYFIDMCNTLIDREADVVLGCRMGRDSKMPRLRRIGNRIFAGMLGLLSRQSVTDCASGMRVIRATSLPRLLPLPNGLDFTPAMSARVLMDGELKLEEVAMRYEERIGRSKLSVLKDGLRFTREIVSAAAYVKPSRITLPIAALLLVAAAGLSLRPISTYLTTATLPEWMIYRFLTMSLLGALVVSLLCATVIAEHVIALSQLRYRTFLDRSRAWWGRSALQVYLAIGLGLVCTSAALVWPGLVAFVTTGEILPETMHWSRLVVAGFFLLTLWQIAATACLLRIIPAMHDRQRFVIEGN